VEKIKLDIVSDNFDEFFSKIVSSMGVEEKAQIPSGLISKLIYRKGVVGKKSLIRLGFLGKIYILFKALRRRVFILVEGSESEGAMSVKDFINYRTAAKEKDFGETPARQLLTHGHFVLGGKELMDGVDYMNMLSVGPAYNYLTRMKGGKRDTLTEWQMQREYVVRFVLTWESNKKKWIREYGVSMCEFLILMYCYHGKPVAGSEMYNHTLVNAYFSTPSAIREGMSSLKDRGYVKKDGVSVGATIRITPIGKHIVDEILDKYAIRC
jgi:hypothetical protein